MINKTKRDYFIKYIYLYIFLLPLDLFNSFMVVSSFLLLIGWILTYKDENYLKILVRRIQFYPIIFILIFILFTYLTLFWSNDFKDGLCEQNLFKYYWITIPILLSTLNKDEAKKGIKIFFISILSYAFFSIGVYLDIFTISSESSNKIGHLLYAYATPMMAFGFFASITFSYYCNNIIKKRIFLGISLIFIISLLLHDGRAGQLSFFVVLFIYLLLLRKSIFNFKRIVTLMLLFLLAGLFLNQFNKLERFKTGIKEVTMILEKGDFQGSWGARAYLWKAAIHNIKEKPLLGNGAGDSNRVMQEYQRENKISISNKYYATHNMHLDLLLKYGLVGYILFWSGILTLLFYLLRYSKKKYFFIAFSFFSIMFFTGFADDIYIVKPFNNVFILIFILFSIIAMSEKNIDKDYKRSK